jgi:hypothetical protein
MTLEATFQELGRHLHTLREGLIGLRTTVVEDKPLGGDTVLVDVFGNAAEDLLGWLEETLAAASEGHQAVAQLIDLNCARRALTNCQERFNRITHEFSSDLVSYERITELMRLGHERRGEWHAWAKSVKNALDGCQELLFGVNQALFRCWQDLMEQVSMMLVTVQTTSIGEHNTIPGGQAVNDRGTRES